MSQQEGVIDYWKPIEPYVPEKKHEKILLQESSFATTYPKYREKYIREIFPQLDERLKNKGISATLDIREGTVTVATTKKCFDPFAIIQSRDVIRLLSRGVPVEHATRVLDDETFCDIIKISGFTSNTEKMVKRRSRLVGPNGSTLKAIELLTKCYVLVQGHTVAAVGSFAGLKQVREIVEDCMKNIHPIYNIKMMMIKRELASDPHYAGVTWDKYLPQFKKKNIKRKKPIKRKKKEDNPFPPEQTPRKIDLQLESGEYFKSNKRRAPSSAESNKPKVPFSADSKKRKNFSTDPKKSSKKIKMAIKI